LKYDAAANFLTGGHESLVLANVAVNGCQDLATLAPKYSNPVANTKAVPAVGTSDFDTQMSGIKF
jgi:hypothetical protein